MSFKYPTKVWSTIESLIDADRLRAVNRSRINLLFNGDQPYSDREAAEGSIGTNVNFLEGTEILHRARIQYENAFLKPENFFSVHLDIGPPHKRQQWSNTITRQLNRRMKKAPRYYHCLESQFAGVVLHGVAPVLWFRDYDWCPKPHGIEDVLVPSNTTTDLENLDYFAVYQTYTMAQLIKATQIGKVDPGWKKPLVDAILKKLAAQLGEPGQNAAQNDIWQFPEKAVELWKSDGGYLAGDAVPVVRAYDFYYKDVAAAKPVWKRKIILDRQGDDFGVALENDGVLYENPKLSYGESIERIMHVQFADGSVVPPFRWHSVRSLGYQLYALCHLLNRLRCRLSDAVFESMMWYFRNDPSGDGELIEKVDLHDRGVIPNNLKWVSPDERHQVDFKLVGGAIQLYRELMQEHSSSYVRDVDASKQSEPETATAVMARVNQSSQLVGAMLTRAYTYQTYQYQEIVRRFCTLNHDDCKKFRDACVRDNVDPRVFKDIEAWDIVPERVLGAGNKMLEVAQADRLMAIVNRLSPRAQRMVESIYITANTDNPQLANLLAPMDDEPPSRGAQAASVAWGTLVDGKPVVVPESIERMDYVETLLQMLAADIQFILKTGGTADIRRIQGLANVVQHVSEQVELIARDEGAQPKVKMYKDILGKAQNEIKGLFQRWQEEQKAAEQDGQVETIAKVQSQLALTQAKIQALEATTAAKIQMDQMRFQAEQRLANGRTVSDIRRQDVTASAANRRQDTTMIADEQRKTAGFIADQARADAEAIAEQERADAAAIAENERKEQSSEE